MKISTEIGSIAKVVGEERTIELCAKAGFDAWDFSMFEMCRWDWGNNRPVDKAHPLNGDNYLAFAREPHSSVNSGVIPCNVIVNTASFPANSSV